ncbi:MAG: erythromycin esterase family protein [Gemmatimonadales bacterium]
MIERKGFTVIGLEADWADAARVDRYVRGLPPPATRSPAFARFPAWMWRNAEFGELVEWVRTWNAGRADPEERVRIVGLDLYSLFESIEAVLAYLDQVDPDAAAIGFGTDHGTVAAASDWGGPMEHMRVRPAHPGSYESLCHQAQVPAFLLALRYPAREEVREELSDRRLERAIGVVYRPETELQSHYFEAELTRQFDEYCWIDETSAVTPLLTRPAVEGEPETNPLGV